MSEENYTGWRYWKYSVICQQNKCHINQVQEAVVTTCEKIYLLSTTRGNSSVKHWPSLPSYYDDIKDTFPFPKR